MAEPLPINLVVTNTITSTEVSYLTAVAYRSPTTVPGSGYNLQWLTSNITTTGFTLSVAYISAGNINASSSSVNITYNVSNFILNIPGRYSFINVSSPITTNIYSNKTLSKIFPPLSTVLTQNASSVQVEFSANYSSINYAPTSISISAVRFDNEPFIRSLTAVIMQDIGGGVKVPALGVTNVRWSFTNAVWAKTPNGTVYNSGTPQPVSAIGTMIFYTSATEYNYRTTNYTLCTQVITVSSAAATQTTNYNLTFDTFPKIDLNLFINYESALNGPYFYRLISGSLYSAKLSANAGPVTFTSTFSTLSYEGWYTTDTVSTKIPNLQPQINFNRINPVTRNATVHLSANVLPGSLSAWYTSHLFTKTLSAKFVPTFLNANFIGYPGTYFNQDGNLVQLNDLNFAESPGMFFYGEGHTDFIYLKSSTPAETYIWRINNSTTFTTLSTIVNGNRTKDLNQPLTNVYLQLTSASNQPLTRLPVSLHTVGTDFFINDPLYFYDDQTGTKTSYPYFYTTTNVQNSSLENPANTRYRQSIQIIPYENISYIFTPGINPIEKLDVNGFPSSYQATFNLTTPTNTVSQTLSCYDKYGIIWKWTTLSACSGVPIPSFWWTGGGRTYTTCNFDFTNNALGTWTSLSCNGPFAKKWRNEGPPNLTGIPTICTTPGIVTWTLSSSSGWPQIYTLQVKASDTDTFPYQLRAKDFGRQLFTTSLYEPTFVTVRASQTVVCRISSISPYTSTNDWVPRLSTIRVGFTAKCITDPGLKLYTPNRYVLTGTRVLFENLFSQKQLITAVTINFGENTIPNLFLTGSRINQNYFSVPGYNTTGYKTITLTGITTLTSSPTIRLRLPNLIKVVDNYDEISPTEYRIPQTPIELPWKNAPQAGTNDWVISDNINSCIKKFDDNLNYLLTRTKEYFGPYTEYFGWLGNAPENSDTLSNCLRWTWEDIDCLNSSLFETVTWRKLLSSTSDVEEDENEYALCSLWENHFVRELSAGNTKPFFCEVGKWHVNIPLLDTAYRQVTGSFIQPRCIYTGVASKNNMLYTSQKTLIKLLSSNYLANNYDNNEIFNGAQEFSNIKNICLDSSNKIYVLDGTLNQVASYIYEPNNTNQKWTLFTNWGGYGSSQSKNKFLRPNDIHIDQLDNIWVTDTGNNCIKHYSNTGTWINTINNTGFLNDTPLSVAVDSEKNVHVLTSNQIYIFTYEGEFIQTYTFKNFTTTTPVKIISSYNREIVYVLFEKAALKYFRNGVYGGTIINENEGIDVITGGYHDEFRNLLITTEDKILKYCDLMTINLRRGNVPVAYQSLSSILIHEDEFVQNWVYTKTFQRLWDNIEIFRNLLIYSNDPCKQYTPPVHSKEKMIIGQNEIVTAATINRVLQYLWENFSTLLNYYNTNCET